MARRYPFVPGAISAIDETVLEQVKRRAEATLPRHPGTVVHVLVLDRDFGLELIRERFGIERAIEVASALARGGPSAHPIIACRVPFTWDIPRIEAEAR